MHSVDVDIDDVSQHLPHNNKHAADSDAIAEKSATARVASRNDASNRKRAGTTTTTPENRHHGHRQYHI